MGLVQNSINLVVSPISVLHQLKTQKQLLEKLIFIQSLKLDRPQLSFDTIDIFRLKEPPYQSLMRQQRTFQCQSQNLLQFSETLRKLSLTINHKNLAPVQLIKINEQSGMCSKSVKIDYYATYYGIELRDIIQNRKKQDWRFQESQILYVAKSLINFGSYLKSQNIAFGLYQSKNIFVTDNGYIKMYLFHILPENKHVNYYHLLSTSPSTLSLYLPIAPDVFVDLQENNLSPNFDYFEADIFSIGMVLVDMMVQSTLQRYYRLGKDGMIFDETKLKKDLNELRQKQIYHPKVLTLIENILSIQPQNRWQFGQVDKYLDDLKTEIQFACRLNFMNELQQNQVEIKNKVSFKSEQPQSEYVLRSIQNTLQSKLNPFPLKSLSKPPLYPLLQSNQTNFDIKKTAFDSSIHLSMYTKRRNTGVSIVSSSSHQNDQSLSKQYQKSSQFITVRNSRTQNSLKFNSAKQKIQKNTKFNEKIKEFEKGKQKDKNSENWLAIRSTRITEQNNKTFNLMAPKSMELTKNNPKLHLYQVSKQNELSINRKQKASSSVISTHIKMHKNSILSPKEKKPEKPENPRIQQFELLQISKQERKNEVIKSVRHKMKLNHNFRG